MADSVLDRKHFHDEEAAYKFVESRVWPQGRICPHCGTIANSGPLKGKSTRIGVYKCYDCRKPFTVKVGTIFESSHIKLHIWLQAMFLLCSSKKGISANQLARTLGITLKSAWFLGHRIREAMKDDPSGGKLGGEYEVVEADETLMGPREYEFKNEKGWVGKKGSGGKVKILTLVQRGGGARSIHAQHMTTDKIAEFVLSNANTLSRLHTDEAHNLKAVGRQFLKHETVNHSKDEYARGDVTTNTVEGYFSVFKRGMRGTYQQCGEKHLQKYLTEFDFRYSNRVALGVSDMERTERALKGVVGKRLTYK